MQRMTLLERRKLESLKATRKHRLAASAEAGTITSIVFGSHAQALAFHNPTFVRASIATTDDEWSEVIHRRDPQHRR